MKWEEGEDGEEEDEAGDVCSSPASRLTNGWSVMVLAAAFQGGRKQARRVSQTSAANAQVRARIAGVVYVSKWMRGILSLSETVQLSSRGRGK